MTGRWAPQILETLWCNTASNERFDLVLQRLFLAIAVIKKKQADSSRLNKDEIIFQLVPSGSAISYGCQKF